MSQQNPPVATIPFLHFSINAFRDFIQANNMTPHIMVRLTPGYDSVLDQYAKDGHITLNVSDTACRNYQISEEGYMVLEQRFNGKPHRAFIPVGWVEVMFARENPDYGQMFVGGDAYGIPINNGKELPTVFPKAEEKTAEEPSNITPLRKGGLTVIK